MSVAYLDTHVGIWLHAGRINKLTRAAKSAIEDYPLLISPMVYLEFDMMYACGRCLAPAYKVQADLMTSFGVEICNQPFAAVAAAAIDIGWTKDPFDRIIVAHSVIYPKSILITADENIRTHYPRAVW